MAKKKLLSEAQVRRFMGLAGIQPTTISNVIQEMGASYMEKEDDPADDESPMPDEPEMAEPEMSEPEMDEPEMDAGEAEVSVDPDDLRNLRDAFEAVMGDLEGATGETADAADDMEGEDMPEPAMDDEEPMEEDIEEGIYSRDDEEDKKKMEEELAEVSLELSEEEIVQEVARRVAKRIIKAKRAKKAVDEARGRK